MKTFKQHMHESLLQEAIPLGKAKDIMRQAGDSYKELFPDVFKGNSRILLPGNITYEDVQIDVENDYSSLYNQIQRILSKNGYELDDFRDYVYNKCYSSTDKDRKNPIKIGKILNRLAQTDQYYNKILQSFTVDPTRIKDNYRILISKHPYDIAGISTDRNWTSCMDMGTDRIHYKGKPANVGGFSESLGLFIKNHALVAYLVSDDDKNKYGKYTLKRPIARILIYPFKSVTEDGEEEYAYHPSSTIYGVDIRKFYDIVKDWVYRKINTDIDDSIVYHKIEGAYYDSIEDEPGFRTELSAQEIANQYDFTYIKYTNSTLEEFSEQSLWDVYIDIPFALQNLYITTPQGNLNIKDQGIFDEIISYELLFYTSLNLLFGDLDIDAFYSVRDIGNTIQLLLQPIRFSKMISKFPEFFEGDDISGIKGAFDILSKIDDEIANNIDIENTITSWLEYAQDQVDDYIEGLDPEDELDYSEIYDIIRNSYYEL